MVEPDEPDNKLVEETLQRLADLRNGVVMDGPESWGIEALKTAMPFQDAQTVSVYSALDAVVQLEKFNRDYVTENAWFDDNSYFKFVPKNDEEIGQAASMLGVYFLTLLHRRGLVGF